jgi:hypothetical protein
MTRKPTVVPTKVLPKDALVDDEGGNERAERSHTAKEIADLQDRILRLASNRERLPQPLFWSLFHSRISEIKKNKELARLLNDVLG